MKYNENWRYENGYFRDDVYDKTQVIAKYENKNNIPNNERITSYFGDMDLYELNDDVTEERFNEIYQIASKNL